MGMGSGEMDVLNAAASAGVGSALLVAATKARMHESWKSFIFAIEIGCGRGIREVRG
jgi:hypothetical protein